MKYNLKQIPEIAARLLTNDYGCPDFTGHRYVEVFDWLVVKFDHSHALEWPPRHKAALISEYLHCRPLKEGDVFNFSRWVCKRAKIVMKQKNKDERLLIAEKMRISLREPVTREAGQAEHLTVLAGLPAEKFYSTKEWRKARLETILLQKKRCQICGIGASKRSLHVDHIITRIARPDLAFTFRNLRVLCEDCHSGRHYADGAAAGVAQ